jgi:hypothetical protein
MNTKECIYDPYCGNTSVSYATPKLHVPSGFSPPPPPSSDPLPLGSAPSCLANSAHFSSSPAHTTKELPPFTLASASASTRPNMYLTSQPFFFAIIDYNKCISKNVRSFISEKNRKNLCYIVCSKSRRKINIFRYIISFFGALFSNVSSLAIVRKQSHGNGGFRLSKKHENS